jgi:hypothetical protein
MPTFDLDNAVILQVPLDGLKGSTGPPGDTGDPGPPGADSTVPGPPGIVPVELTPILSVSNSLAINLDASFTGYVHTLTQNTTLLPSGDLTTTPRALVVIGGSSTFTVTWDTNIIWKSGRPRNSVPTGTVIYTELFSRGGIFYGVMHPAPLGPSGRHAARYTAGAYKLYYDDITLPANPADRDYYVDIDWNDGAGNPDPITAGLIKAGDHVTDTTTGA